MGKNRIDLKQYKTGGYLRTVIWHFDLRNHFGYPLTKRGPCPFCSVGRPGKKCFAVDLDRGGWYCHACLRNGDALTLWAGIAEVSVWQAAVDLSNLSGNPVPWIADELPPAVSEAVRNRNKEPGHSFENNTFADEPPGVKGIVEDLLGTGYPPPLSMN